MEHYDYIFTYGFSGYDSGSWGGNISIDIFGCVCGGVFDAALPPEYALTLLAPPPPPTHE